MSINAISLIIDLVIHFKFSRFQLGSEFLDKIEKGIKNR